MPGLGLVGPETGTVVVIFRSFGYAWQNRIVSARLGPYLKLWISGSFNLTEPDFRLSI
jgi:hypothetical protein